MSGQPRPAARTIWASSDLRASLQSRVAACVLVLVTSGLSGLSALVIDEGGCGALCRRTCCKPTNCLVLRGTCCCTERGPGPATTGPSDEALPAPNLHTAVVLSPEPLAEHLDTSAAARHRSVPHPPPRA